MSSLGLRLDPRMPAEPLTNNPLRHQWVEEEALRVARSHQSYMANHLSSNTVHKMQQKESITLADADGDGTIDKEEFAALLAAAGGQDNAEDMGALFAAADADGDGELTEEEIKALSEFKRKRYESQK
jgi:Ca2+-binding EF-hand superfamily protein